MCASFSLPSCQTLIGLDEVGPRARDSVTVVGGSPGAGTGGAAASGAPAVSGTTATGVGAGGIECDANVPLVDTLTLPPIPVVAAAQAPTIDGDVDAVWCSARVFKVLLKAGEGAPASFATEGRALWDDRHLYLLLEVVNEEVYESAFFWYENDHAWVGLDPTPVGTQGDELLFGFTTTTRDLQNFEAWPEYDRSRILLAQRRIGNALFFEVSVPWELFPNLTAAVGREVGFELRTKDTSDGQAFSSLSWASVDDESDGAPSSWGRLLLQ